MLYEREEAACGSAIMIERREGIRGCPHFTKRRRWTEGSKRRGQRAYVLVERRSVKARRTKSGTGRERE
jgi:hypothetical protein